jgi:DNA-binding FadR family transcriptional regulator
MVASQAQRRDVASAAAPAPAPRKLADMVYEQLYRLITRGEFPKGCKLPPEGALTTRFGVSRPVIRDALGRLKGEGFVRSQRGSGNVVVRGELPGLHAYPPIRTVSDLLRSTIHHGGTATAAMAAERREAATASRPHARSRGGGSITCSPISTSNFIGQWRGRTIPSI